MCERIKEPYFFKLKINSFECPEEHGVAEIDVPILLPHEIWAALWRQGSSRWSTSIGSKEAANQFWDHTSRYSAWAARHPITGRDVWPDRVVPIGLYGDGAKVTKVDTIVWSSAGCCWGECFINPMLLHSSCCQWKPVRGQACVTWYSLLAPRGPAVDTKFLALAVPTTFLRAESFDEMSRVLHWSLAAMYDGTWPTCDHLGRPWQQTHCGRGFMSGSELAGGLALCLRSVFHHCWSEPMSCQTIFSPSNAKQCASVCSRPCWCAC